MRSRHRVGRRGFAIFISIGVLALLSILASTFAMMSQMERSVAGSYVDQVRAKLLANAGIEMAVSRLGRLARTQAFEDLNSPWVYRDGPGVDIESCTQPSFQEAGSPIRSGRLAATYDGGTDLYVVKVLDSASMIDLNAPLPNLPTILENLGQGIADLRGTNPIPVGMGAAIVNYRNSLPSARLRTKSDLLNVPGMSRANYELLKDFVCVECYRDDNVIVPNPSANFPGNWPNAGQLLRNISPPPGRPAGTPPIGRATINLNTAPYPVLVAWAAGLSGYAVETAPTGPARLGTAPVQFVKTQVPAITYAEAQQIANQVISRRQVRPFRTMDDVAMFIDCPLPVGNPRNPYPNGLVQLGVISRQKGWVLMAMADPNLTTNKIFPTAPAFNPVDKQDLTFVTFEACFSSMGFYEIEALGRVLAPNGSIRADARVRTTARIYRVLRQTTQGELTNISGFSTAMMDKVNSYPESIQDFGTPSPFEGMLQLSSEWQTASPGGAVVGWTRYRSQLPWDGGGAGMAAIAGSVDPKDEGGTVFGLSDLHPDGVMTIRQAPEMLSYRTPTSLTPRDGAIEFWVKLLTPPTVGSDEPLLYITVTGSSSGGGNNASTTGTCVKLERFGTMLRCTRFFWGYPDPAVSPYWHLYVEREALIDNWQANEWHHIAIQWREYDRPQYDEWQEYDYWSEGRAYFWNGMAGADQVTVYGAPDVNLYMFIDGTPVTRLFTRYSQNRTYIVDWPPEATTLQRRVRLASKTPPPGWRGGNQTFPQGTIDVGGYEFDRNTNAPVYIYRQGTWTTEYIQRYSNSVIDDMTVYSQESFNKAGFSPPERFRVTGGAYLQHAIDLRNVTVPILDNGTVRNASVPIAPNAVIGTLRWNQRLPWAWRDRWLWPTPGTDQAPYVGCSWGVGNTVTSPAVTTMNACEGVVVGLPRGAADRLTYRFDFLNPGGIFPLNVTPVVEDVVCTVIESPAFVSWESQ